MSNGNGMNWRRLGALWAALSVLLVVDVHANNARQAVLWYAPFLSGGGYCSEAHSYVEAIDWAVQARNNDAMREAERHADDATTDSHLHTAGDGSGDTDASHHHAKHTPFGLYITQHGDSYNAAFIRDMPEEMRELLQQHWIEERDFAWRLKKTNVVVAVCHSEPGAWFPAHYKTSRCPPEQAKYKVGRTMFETDRVPSGWAERMNAMDEIWVPTKFQQKIFVDGGVRPDAIHVLPEAVDVHFFDPATVEDAYDVAAEINSKQITDETTVFLSVFKWEERKGWRVLLKAYFQAFSKDEDVVLAVLTNGYHIASESPQDFLNVIREFAQSELGKALSELPLVHVLPPNLPQTQLPSLYKAASAFVLPSRGEGWGRPHVEAMAMALPIISTFWSGTTEYMTEQNSYPLRIDGLVEIPDGAFRGHQWADPSVKHLIELLQRVHQRPDEAREKGQQARRDMVEKYSPEVIGKVLLAHIERILAAVAEREQVQGTAAADEQHDEL